MKTRWKVGLLIVGSLLLTLWSYGRLSAARGRTLRAMADLRECGRLADEIKKLSEQPERASLNEIREQELTGRIEALAKQIGIEAKQILRIDPEPPRRVGETAYMEKPTRLELERVTLPTLVRFLHELGVEVESLRVKDLRLQAPHGEEVGDRWRSEVTLSYLLYSPETKKES